MIFKRDVPTALAKQRALLAADEQKITELLRTRAAVLLESESVTEVEELDQRVAALRRACAIHRDRIAALEVQVRAEARERLEHRRIAAVKVIEKKLAARTAVATELEAAVRRYADLYFELLAAPNIAADWPWRLPALATVDAGATRREVGWLLFAVGRASGGRTVLPSPSNGEGLGVAGIHPAGVSAMVAGRSQQLLALLREMPLVDDAAADEDMSAETVPSQGLTALATT